MELTTKQKRFIDEYLKCGNACRAAVLAGYSERSARQQGWENLSKPYISEEIERRLVSEALSANEVLWRLARMARADMGDFIKQAEDGDLALDLDAVKRAGLTDLIKKITQHTSTRTFEDGGTQETSTFTIELHDAQSALKELGRVHKLFRDGLDVSGGLTVSYDGDAEAELSRRLDAIGERLRSAESLYREN